MIPTIAGVILLIFFLFNWVGGDPAQVLAGKISNPEQIANIRKQLGVDQPYWYQLWVFVQQVFTFDFGRSWSTNEEVSRILLTRVGPDAHDHDPGAGDRDRSSRCSSRSWSRTCAAA
jgi:peptide/nickel transport system permease protein